MKNIAPGSGFPKISRSDADGRVPHLPYFFLDGHLGEQVFDAGFEGGTAVLVGVELAVGVEVTESVAVFGEGGFFFQGFFRLAVYFHEIKLENNKGEQQDGE